MTEPSNLSQRLQEGYHDTHWATEVNYVTDNGRIIMEAIRQKNAITVTHGSFKSEIGTFAYAIEG